MSELSRVDAGEILRAVVGSSDARLIAFQHYVQPELLFGYQCTSGTVVVKYQADGKSRELRAFSKTVPTTLNEAVSAFMAKRLHKEARTYQTFLRHICQKFQCDFVPRCFLYKEPGFIVLEDMENKRFENIEVSESLDMEHCEKAMEALAKLHSYSLILEAQSNKSIEALYPELVKRQRAYSDVTKDIKVLQKVVDEYLPQFSKSVTDEAFGLMKNALSYLRYWEEFKNVVIHGDIWMNKLMFRYDEHGILEEVGLVGFQCASICCPTFDVQWLLYTCTKRWVREQHWYHLLRHYHRTMAAECAAQGIQLEAILPFHSLLLMYESTLPVIMALAPLLLHMDLMPPDVLTKVSGWKGDLAFLSPAERCTAVMAALSYDQIYRERLLESLVELFHHIMS